jgi:hypothetical protein
MPVLISGYSASAQFNVNRVVEVVNKDLEKCKKLPAVRG